MIKKKGKPVADASQRDTENVPLTEDINTYFEREVLPCAPDAWIDTKKTKVGYEIPMTRYFYEYQAPEPVEEIAARLHELELDIQSNSAKLLNMEEVIVQKVENAGNELHVYIMLPRKMHKCPCCGSKTNRIHDYRDQKIKDVPLGRTTYLHLRKRRYVCGHCGKRFAEKNPIAARYYRLTRRCVVSIINPSNSSCSIRLLREKAIIFK